MASQADGAAAPTELDLTSSHLSSLQGVDIPPTLTALDLTTNRLADIDPRILQLTGLRSINLRQNLLADASPWQSASCKATLEDLELRDNQLTQIPDLSGFDALRRLEVSYNQIRSLAPLQLLQPAGAAQLQELYVAACKVTAIEALSHLTALKILELGFNRIPTMAVLPASLANLEQLWLGRNRIAAIECLRPLSRLRKVSVQSNRLESMAGLEACTALEEVYLSHNGITRLEGLSTLSNLKLLDVSSNRITTVECLEALTQLEDLWLNDNQIASWEGLPAGLAPVAPSVTTVYLSGNPVAEAPDYKQRVRGMLPRLTQLDADNV